MLSEIVKVEDYRMLDKVLKKPSSFFPQFSTRMSVICEYWKSSMEYVTDQRRNPVFTHR